jgi:HEAT repeat protein
VRREYEYQIPNYPGDVIQDNAEGQSISSDTASIVDRRLKVTRLEVTRLGFNASLSSEQRALLLTAMGDPDDRVRAGALGAIVRLSSNEAAQAVIEPAEVQEAWRSAQVDQSPNVRRRAAELAPKVSDLPIVLVIELVADSDVTVAEAAAWALGEMTGDDYPNQDAGLADATLEKFALSHKDALVREACVAALGARGVGLATILAACSDKPAVRRRAVLALSPFEGPEVNEALENALTDRDWQVRQAAEDLLGIDAGQQDDADAGEDEAKQLGC